MLLADGENRWPGPLEDRWRITELPLDLGPPGIRLASQSFSPRTTSSDRRMHANFLPWAFLFASPLSALAALTAAVSVPVVIHLLHRRRFVIVPWAAMRFLLAAQKQNVRRMRLEQWLLLLVRILIVAFVVVAMSAVMPWAESLWRQLVGDTSQPQVTTGRTHRIIVLDGSLSLATREGDQSLFERARQQAQQLIRASKPGDGLSLVLLGPTAQAIVSGPADNPERVLREVQALHQPHGNADLAGGLNLIAGLVQRSPPQFAHREVIVFSDYQRATWLGVAFAAGDAEEPSVGKVSGTELWQAISDRATTAVVQVANEQPPNNLAVTNLALGDALVIAGGRTTVSATIHNYGTADRHGVLVEFLVARVGDTPDRGKADGGVNMQPVRPETIDLPAGGTGQTVTFAHSFTEPGEYVVQVRVEPDALEQDNTRSLVVRVRETVPVLLVNGRPEPEPTRQATYHLARALNPFPPNAPNPIAPARPEVVTYTAFSNPGLVDLTRFEAVFLCDVPTLTERDIERLDAHLKRGGGVVIGLGPAVNLDDYNRIFNRKGNGLLPVPFGPLVKADQGSAFTLTAEEEEFLRPPLAAFQSDRDRAALTASRVERYVRVALGPRSEARRMLSFLPPSSKTLPSKDLDPALIDWPTPRGRLMLLTTSFSQAWTTWPLSPSYLPFVQELMRVVVPGAVQRVVTVGEPVELQLPAALVGLEATITRPDRSTETVTLTAGAECATVRLPDTDQCGLYRVVVAGQRDELFAAVNPPATTAQGNSESDLRRLLPGDLATLPGVQFVSSLDAIVRPSNPQVPVAPRGTDTPSETPADTASSQSAGSRVAWGLLWAVLLLLLVESVLAWRYGAARATATPLGVAEPSRTVNWGLRLASAVPVVVCLALLALMAHAAATGEALSFLGEPQRTAVESALGVPPSPPGETTRWLPRYMPYFTGDWSNDGWLVLLVGLGLVGLFGLIYAREASAVSRESAQRGLLARLIRTPMLLRLTTLALLLLVLLPQLRLSFERESWPEVALLLDDSQSMSIADAFNDPQLRQQAQRLGQLVGLDRPQRLQLAQALLTHPETNLLSKLVARGRVRVHVYQTSRRLNQIAEVTDPEQLSQAYRRINSLEATGQSSPLGSAVRNTLGQFRGSSLGAIIFFTDGITTEGDDLPAAAQHARRAGVPLILVGMGDATLPQDLMLSDLQVEETVQTNDKLVFEAKLIARGLGTGSPLPVILYEKQTDKLVELARVTVQPDTTGQPVRFRLTHTPTKPGEQTYVIETPALPGESDTLNNRLERTVQVTTPRRIRVLYLEGSPRYEYRFVRTLLEREDERLAANKSIDMRTLLLDADREQLKEDPLSARDFPTAQELANYDVVIVGDIDPRHRLIGEQNLKLLSEFVKARGGLVFVAGEQHNPQSYFDTPLRELLPIAPDAQPAPVIPNAPYRLQLTASGKAHPIFRFSPDQTESAEILAKLMPQYWSAQGTKRRPSAEVLALHPDLANSKTTDGLERSPLVVQQFVGAGRVLFFGFDETWRWRFRDDEIRFNQFWIQTIRYLARFRQERTELTLDRQTPYRRGEPIRVTVRFPDDAPPPDQGNVEVAIKRQTTQDQLATDRQTLRLARVQGSRATYEGVLTRTPEGQYTFTLASPTSKGRPPCAEARVLPPAGEMDRLEMNQTDLERAARETRGRFYTLADVERLADELPAFERVSLDQAGPDWLVWNHWLIFAVLIALLTCEWLWRKRQRLA